VTGNIGKPIVIPLRGAGAGRRLALLLMMLMVLLAGCGTTQLSPPGRRLLEAVQTAVSARNSQWLEAAAQQVDTQHDTGPVPQADYQALQAIIAAARAGDWEGAQKRTFALSEGQRPSAEDLARARQRMKQ
jgi:hypothetical protein